jgi:antitoxin ChpS
LPGERGAFLDTKLQMVDLAYEALLTTGIYIQPLPIWETEWTHPERATNPRLIENIQRDGIVIDTS